MAGEIWPWCHLQTCYPDAGGGGTGIRQHPASPFLGGLGRCQVLGEPVDLSALPGEVEGGLQLWGGGSRLREAEGINRLQAVHFPNGDAKVQRSENPNFRLS